MENLKKKLNKCLTRSEPFVFYRKPHSDNIEAIIQKDDAVNYFSDYSVSGFVFSPFDDSQKSYIIPAENSTSISFSANVKKKFFPLREIENFNIDDRRNYIDLAQKAVDLINNSDIQKIVTSRKEKLEARNIDIFYVLENLLNCYQEAFVYVWFHPLTGIWMGATPELLLEVNANMFKTMALAGTKSYKGTLDSDWGTKEIQEQKFVTEYIRSKLENKKLKIGKPFTIKAGSLQHICSEIKGELASASEFNTLIRALHPTPAICGIPKDNAKQFILKNEKYDREFYTGYLGENAFGAKTNLYVNLRCMKINKKSVDIYIGGGITKDSIPEDEWEETCIKSEVMKRVL